MCLKELCVTVSKGAVIKYDLEGGGRDFFLTEIFSWPSELFSKFNAPAQNYRNF